VSEHQNRLKDSASPYLRSAAHQPINWHEWNDAVFARAESEDKPILLDIGAVWCHWCHVIDRESYENVEIAKIINEHFVPVKVDRDERPDVDARYQSAIALAEHANDAKLESLALAHLADLQDKRNSTAAAAQSYQRALSLDAKAADPRSEGFDWFNYGQFLRRHQAPSDLVYACLLHAENLLQNSDPAELQTVQTARREVAGQLGKKAPTAQKDLPALLARAANLPAGSL